MEENKPYSSPNETKGYNPRSDDEIHTARILNELVELTSNPPDGITVIYNEHITMWTVYLTGPKDTNYEGLVYELVVWLPEEYPFKPPHVSFKSKIFHPNIPESGLFMLLDEKKWCPVLTMSKLFLSIQGILSIPDPNTNVYNDDAAYLYQNNPEKYKNRILEYYTRK